jgi:hypothetical protein
MRGPGSAVEIGGELLSAAYFQHPKNFSDEMTAPFGPASELPATLLHLGRCVLEFEQFTEAYPQTPARDPQPRLQARLVPRQHLADGSVKHTVQPRLPSPPVGEGYGGLANVVSLAEVGWGATPHERQM